MPSDGERSLSDAIIALRGARLRRNPEGNALAEDLIMGRGAFIGNSVTIYPKVRLDDDCIVMDGAVIGRPPISNGSTTRRVSTRFEPVSIGKGSIVGCNAVIYTGTHFGSRVLVGDLASVREGCVIGDGVILGRSVMALYNCQIGPHTRIQDQAHLVGDMLIEEHVFVGMGVTTTNDNEVYLGRFGLLDTPPKGPTFRRYSVVGAGATILPGLEIGEGALVAAGAVVTHDVKPWTVVAGVPARELRPVPNEWRRRLLDAVAARDTSASEPLSDMAPLHLRALREPTADS